MEISAGAVSLKKKTPDADVFRDYLGRLQLRAPATRARFSAPCSRPPVAWHAGVVTLQAATSLFFFFSSRRRHTRWPRDWSSVCSSDLFHLPVSSAASARVRGWEPDRLGEWS